MENKDNRQKRINLNMRGQKGSTKVHYALPVIDLNWRRMNERRDNRGRYYPSMKEELRPLIIEEPLGLGCGAIQGYNIVIRGSPEYRY